MNCKIIGDRLKNILNIMSVANSDINIFFEKDKIIMQNQSEGRVVLMETVIKPKALEEYKIDSNFLIKINTINLRKFLMNVKEKEILTVDFDKNESNIIFTAKKSKFKLRLIDSSDVVQFILPDERKKTDDKKPLEYNYEIKINDFQEFKNCIAVGKTIDEVIFINVAKNKLTLESKSKLGEFSEFFDNIEFIKFKENSSSKIQIVDLSNFLSQISKKFILKGGNDMPIKISLNPFNFVEVKFNQAPRIELETE